MIKIFSDSADMNSIKEQAKNPLVKGFTTNPTLMYKAGITDYEKFARDAIYYLHTKRPDTCLSLEVFADEPDEIIRQAKKINSWTEDTNYTVYVKIPVQYATYDDKDKSINSCITELLNENIKLNITAVMTPTQLTNKYNTLSLHKVPSIISVFAGRLYDTGIDAQNMLNRWIIDNKLTYTKLDTVEILWASPRQVYDYVLAQQAYCDIITMTPELIKKLELFGYDSGLYSQETVQMFYEDGKKAGFKI